VKTVDQQLLDEIWRVMRDKGVTQTEFAESIGSSRQSVNPYLKGHKGVFSGTIRKLLEHLDVDIKLEPRKH
jgi:transcriptional regulator with XRE-family HTH domain